MYVFLDERSDIQLEHIASTHELIQGNKSQTMYLIFTQRGHKVLTTRGVLMLPGLQVRDTSPQPRVTTGRHSQSYQLSPAHLNPLLCVNHTHCSHQHHHQRHQTLGRHCAIVIAPRS